MELSNRDIVSGKKFISGEWRADYAVNFFSNDLAHIPASEFKDGDGNDLSSISVEFFDDNTVKITEHAKNRCNTGRWEQTDLYEYKWHFDSINGATDLKLLKDAATLSVFEGDLVFSAGFLTVALKKVNKN